MASRMDRYSDSNKEQFSRSKRNEELYENLGSNTRYTNITDVTNANAFNLENVNNEVKTRESYHKIKDYQEPIFKPKEQRELEDFNYLYQDHENRIYDINRILEEAHKNRVLEDDKEEKEN